MNRSDCYRLERPLAGQDSHLLGGTAFPRRTNTPDLILRGNFGLEGGLSVCRSDSVEIWLPVAGGVVSRYGSGALPRAPPIAGVSMALPASPPVS